MPCRMARLRRGRRLDPVRWSTVTRIGSATLLAAALAGAGLEGYSQSRRPPAPSARSRANDTPVLDHVAGGGPYGGQVTSLAVTRTLPATVYVSLLAGGVYRSTNQGGTWLPADRGLPPDVGCDLVADPVDAATLYAACGDGLFKTVDGGRRWRQLDIDNPVAPIVSAADPQVLYDGALWSRDGGQSWARQATWTPLGQVPGRSADDLRADGSGSVLYARQGGGLVRSADGGYTWRTLPVAWPQFGLWTYAIDPRDPQVVYVGTWDGPFVSLDGGETWEVRARGLTRAAATVVVHESASSVLFAAVGPDVSTSADGGRTWESVRADAFPDRVDARSLASDGVGGVLLRAGTRTFRLKAGASTWVDGTADGGTTWRGALPSGVVPSAVIQVGNDPRHLVAAIGGLPALIGGARSSVWRSVDGGETWVLALAPDRGSMAHCCALLREPNEADTLYAVLTGMVIGGGGAEVFRSADAGVTWTAAGWLESGVAVVPTRPTTLLGQDYQRGLVRSVDGGATWTASNAGLPGKVDVTNYAFDRRHPTTIFAATRGRGIYRSEDAGLSWTPAGHATRP